MRQKLLKDTADKAKPSEKPYEIRDTELRGLILRVQPSGRKSYICQFGRGLRVTMGDAKVMTLERARKKAKGILGDWEDKGIDPRRTRRIDKSHTLRSYLDDVYQPWMEANRKRGAQEVARIRVCFKDLLGQKLDEITPWLVEKWRAKRLKGGISPNTVNRDIAPLKAAMTRAAEWKYVEGAPLSSVKPSKIDRTPRVRYLDQDEERRLRGAMEAREQELREGRERFNKWRRERGMKPMPAVDGDHLKPMVLLSINTGLRQGELFKLTWADVDLGQAILTVRGGREGAKSEQTRHVPLNAEALAVLRGLEHRKGLVFPSRDGHAFTNVKRSWGKVLKKAQISAFRWHDIRHTFASKLVMAGVDLNTVRELLGHSDLKMTLRYAHLAPEHKAEAVSRLVAV